MTIPVFTLSNTASVLPKLALDFTTASLDSRITFTRALNTATRVNSSGLVEVVNANTPRFDYDSSLIGTCKGLLIEEQRTNLVIYSEQFDNIIYTKSGSSVTSDSIVSPSGIQNADSLIENSATSVHALLYTGATLSANITSTFSIYVKPKGRNCIRLALFDDTTGVDFCRANFDLSAFTYSVSNVGLASGATASIEIKGNGWYRLSLSGKPSISVNNTRPSIYLLQTQEGAASYTGDGTSGVYIWGAQLEAGAFPTSYIPTTTTALTRNADVATMTGTNFSDWYNASEGTFEGQFSIPYLGDTVNFNAFLAVDDGTINNAMQLSMWDAASDTLRWVGHVSGVAQWSIAPKIYTANTTTNGCGGYKLNNFNAAFDTTLGTQNNSGNVPTVNIMRIGCNRGGFGYLNGYVKKIAYYSIRVTNSELQAFSK